MTEDILINCTPQETRVGVMQAGVPQELHVERAANRGLVGNIYVGKVARVLTGMQVPRREMPQFRQFLASLGYPWVDETRNPAYRLFLGS